MDKSVEEFMIKVKEKNPGEKEFHQAVQEVVESLMPFIQKNPKYKKANSVPNSRPTTHPWNRLMSV